MIRTLLLLSSLLVLSAVATVHLPQCPSLGQHTKTDNVFLILGADDAFPSDPIGGDNDAGFSEYLGFDLETTQEFYNRGMAYLEWRFGIDGSVCDFDTLWSTQSCLLYTNPSAPDVPTVAIQPVTYTAGNTYRVLASNSLLIPVFDGLPEHPVLLAEFIMTFISELNVSGTYGAEMNPEEGYVTFTIPEGQVAGDGVAFGRYVICSGLRNFTFDMRSWFVSHRWAASQEFPYTEKFQIGSLQTDLLPDGSGAIDMVYPTGPIVNAQGQDTFPWKVRTLWELGTSVAYPELNNWNVACSPACDTKQIPASS